MTSRAKEFGRHCVCVVLALFIGLACAVPAGAGITATGNLDPAYGSADPWDLGYGDLIVGNTADGGLEITLGSAVSSFSGALGFMPGTTGSLAVTDPNSAWTMDEDFIVGVWGHGDLEITNGGQVTNDDGYIGGCFSGILGDEVDTVGYDPNGTGQVLVSGAGSSWTSTDFLYVGYGGDANMVIADGGQVSDEYGIMGTEAGVEAEVTVSGPNSVWVNTSGLGVGLSGNADLLITAGGQVTSLESGIGIGPNSVGAVTVTGADSLWSNTEELAVGAWGTGTLTIANGGLVTSNDIFVGGFDLDAPNLDLSLLGEDPTGTGTVTVTGAGSQLDVNDFLYVGYTGTGTLDVNEGGVVTSAYGVVGSDPNSTGAVTVNGADSEWTVSQDMVVGGYGQGDLTISAGGFVYGYNVYVGGFDVAAFDVDPNEVPQGTGTVTVTGAGSELDVHRRILFVGYTGDGEVTVTEGGQVTTSWTLLGHDATGNGAVTVSGDGSTWDTGTLTVAHQGQGQVLIEDGGLLNNSTSKSSYIGNGENGVGVVTVRDPNSRWTTLGHIYVGGGGDGTLNVSNGAQVTSLYGTVGFMSTGVGQVNVTGADSQWTTELLNVGNTGEGTLAISSGGTVEAGNTYVGNGATGVGHVTVSDANSLWRTDDLNVGYRGEGTLAISTGGTVDANEIVVGAYNTGTLLVSAGGTLDANSVSIGLADGLGDGTATVTGAGSQWTIDSGLYIGGTAAQAGGTGVLDVNDGGVVTASEVRIWEDGTLSGDGTLTASTVTSSGTIAPGNSIGTLTIDGDLTMDANSVFAVEIDNSDNSDKLVVTGDAQLAGTVQVASDETIRGTHEYTILDANSVTGEFDTVDTALVKAGAVTAVPGYGATTVTLELTALPFDIGQTRNQRSLGTGLETIALGGGNTITSLLQAVPTDEELLAHYDQLGGQSRSSLAPITVAGTSRFMGAVSHRLRHPFATSMLSADGSTLSGQTGQDTTSASGMSYEISTNGYNFAVGNGTPYLGDRKWGFWGKGYGLFGSRDDDVESPGYDYTTYGVSFGLDYQVSEKLLLGVTAGYGDGDVDYDRLDDSTDLESTHFGLYGTWDAESLYLDSLLMYTDLDYETERNVDLTDERLEGDFGGYALSGYFETGFDWRRVRGWLLQPLASFQFSYLDLDSYTESGGDAALGYDDQSYESYKGSLGMKVTKNLLADEVDKSLVAQFRARWLHEFGDTYSSVDTYFASEPTTVFSIRDEDMARDSAVLGAGLGAQLNASTRLYADYDVRLNVDDTAHFVSAGLRYQW